jgi:hypothetical protein
MRYLCVDEMVVSALVFSFVITRFFSFMRVGLCRSRYFSFAPWFPSPYPSFPHCLYIPQYLTLMLPTPLSCPQYLRTSSALRFLSSFGTSRIPRLPQYLRFYRRDSRLSASHVPCTRYARDTPSGARVRLALRG